MAFVKTFSIYLCLVLFISEIIGSKTTTAIEDDIEKNDEKDKLAQAQETTTTLQDLEAAKPSQNEPQNVLKVKKYQKHGEDYRRTILSQL